MLSAKRRAEIRHYDPHLFVIQMECRRQFATITEGSLGARPNRELPIGPLGDCCARLQGRVLDVRYIVSLAQRVFCLGHFVRVRISHVALRVLFQVIKQFFARRMRFGFPFRRFGNCLQRFFGLVGCGGGHPDELFVANRDNVFHRFHRSKINVGKGRAVRRSTQHFAVKHPGANDVGRKFVLARYDLPTIRPRRRNT